jgi:hypothetical protein
VTLRVADEPAPQRSQIAAVLTHDAQLRRVLCALKIEVEGVHDEDECDLRRNKRMRQTAIRLRPKELLDSPREGIEWLEGWPQPYQRKSPASPLSTRQARANRTMHASSWRDLSGITPEIAPSGPQQCRGVRSETSTGAGQGRSRAGRL